MNSQSDYTPESDMQAMGFAGNAASRQRLAERKQPKAIKQSLPSGKKPKVAQKDKEAIEKALKKDLSNRGIN